MNESERQKVKKRNLRFFFILGHFAAWIHLMGCSAGFSSPPQANHILTDASFIQFVENNLGTDWYGIYVKEGKIGYLKSSSGFRSQTQK